jgi:hypothetical protein
MDHVETVSLLIRLGVGIPMILFGISQLRTPEKWLKYMPGLFRFILPVKATSFMRVHSVGNLLLGALLAAGVWEPAILWITIFWWVSILPYAFYYEYSVGLRDASIIMALIALLVLNS